MTLTFKRKTFYNISEACHLAGTNRNTYLRWVREKKLADVQHRDRNGWRLFTTEELRQLKNRVNMIQINKSVGR